MNREVNNQQDVLDSRDIIERIDELEKELGIDPETVINDMTEEEMGDNPELYEELETLRSLASDGENYSDWKHGATLIRESYFTDYAQELCEDCGYIPKDFPFFIAIDWEKTAKNIQSDYSSIEYDGITYYIR